MTAIVSVRATLCFSCAGYEFAVAIQADSFHLDVRVRAHYFPILVTISVISLYHSVSNRNIEIAYQFLQFGTMKSRIFKVVSQIVAIKSLQKAKKGRKELDVNS